MSEVGIVAPAGAGGSLAGATADRSEWLRSRRLGIGSTDIAAIMGRSPWASPWSVWASKVGLAPDDEEEDTSAQMHLGRDLEPVIATWFRRATGLDVAGEQMMIWRPGHPFFATVDGLVLESLESGREHTMDDVLGVFEAKYTAEGRWAEIPEQYVLQVQWAMACGGFDRAWLACMHLPFGRPRFEVYELARDDALVADMLTVADRFWTEHVVAGIPPATDGHPATTSALAVAWVDPVAEPVVDLGDLRDVVHELGVFRATRKLLDADIAAAENAIKCALESHSEGHIDGELVCSWRQQGRTDIDGEAVHRDHGDRYDTHSTHRVLRLHGKRSA